MFEEYVEELSKSILFSGIDKEDISLKGKQLFIRITLQVTG
ncbi:MAG: hypothetical protein PWQ82_1816 [Thermosediminibacterales bacterium]|nr:hypothetical protein [Thermosediminibacterales bacterium]